MRRAQARSASTLLAGGFALVSIGVLVFFMVRPSGTSGSTASAPPPPDAIEDLLAPGAEQGRGMTIQIADKDDPTRLAAEVLAARYDPDGPMHRRVEEPRAWLFGEDGSTWYIEADRGRFFIPEGADTPREGFLDGNVRARRYAPVASGRPDPASSAPELTATTDEALRFNLEMLHFETEGRLEIISDELEFAGRGAYVVLNEQRESISALRVDRGERLVYTPLARVENEGDDQGETATTDAGGDTEPVGGAVALGERETAVASVPLESAPTDPGPASPSEGTPTPDPTAIAAADATRDASGPGRVGTDPAEAGTPIAADQAAEPPPPPKIDVYEIVFEDRVELVSGTRSVDADLLTVWVRLVDGKIPDRTAGSAPAVPGLSAGPTGLPSALTALALAAQEVRAEREPVTAEEAAGDGTTGVGGAPTAFTEAVSPPAAPPAGEPVVLTWEGPLEIFPRDDDAEPLAMGDDVALRFEEEEEPVRFADSADGATGRAKSALYFAGRERIELLGPGGAVELESPKAGAIRDTSKLAIELGTGYVLVPASGVLTGRPDGDGPGPDGTQRIAWDGAAEFRFAVEDGRMTDRLELAAFDGGGDGLVEGTNRDAELTGSRLEALFDSEPGGDARLVQLNVADARAEDGRGGRISGDGLEVHFARGRTGEDLDPTRAIIRGNALAQREGRETIRADLIDASLARAEPEQAGGSGDIIVTVAEAEGSVEFDDGAGVAGRGETLWADALEEKAVIGGEGARVRRDGTEITGPRIDLDSKARRVAVEGEGTFTHDGGGGDARSITASWTERMTFDDLAGSVECVGGVNAETVGPDRTRDRAEAARLVVDLDPFDEDAEETGDAGQRVRRAVVFGTPDERAVVESRRVAADSPEDAPRVDELFRLEGEEIRFAARDDRVEVPTPGRLFMLDRRPAPGDGEAGPAANGGTDALAAPGGRSGTSLFTWDGSLVFDRTVGRATFQRNVRAANKPLDGSALTDVTSDRLVAAFAVSEAGSASLTSGDAVAGDLLWAEAIGNAVLTAEAQREVSADRLLYDAAGGEIKASGSEGRRVRVRDLLRGTSSTFSAMRWDLATDTIEFIQPGSIVTPE